MVPERDKDEEEYDEVPEVVVPERDKDEEEYDEVHEVVVPERDKDEEEYDVVPEVVVPEVVVPDVGGVVVVVPVRVSYFGLHP